MFEIAAVVAGQGNRHDYEADRRTDLDRDVAEQAELFSVAGTLDQEERQAQEEPRKQGRDRGTERQQW